MKKVLILVLTMDQGIYRDLMLCAMDTWDSAPLEGTKTLFYCGNEGKQSTERIFYTNVPESLANMGRKAQEAFRHALSLKFDWDFIFRVNISCYVNKRLVLKYVQDKPTHNLALGVCAPITLDNRKTKYMWGPAYLLSRDIVSLVVQNSNKWNHGWMEDVALSQLLLSLGIELNSTGCLASLNQDGAGWFVIPYNLGPEAGGKITHLQELERMNIPVLRIKQDLKRHLDLKLMKDIHAIIKQ